MVGINDQINGKDNTCQTARIIQWLDGERASK
jgi:hypothetical protein